MNRSPTEMIGSAVTVYRFDRRRVRSTPEGVATDYEVAPSLLTIDTSAG